MLNVWLKAAAWTAMLRCLVGLPVSVDEWDAGDYEADVTAVAIYLAPEATATFWVSTNWPSKS